MSKCFTSCGPGAAVDRVHQNIKKFKRKDIFTLAQDMKRLARMFDQLQTDIARCSRCGMCQGVCPLYGQTRNESDVARGKLALLDALGHQVLDRADGVLDRLNRCLLCGSCAAACPNSVDGMSIFLKARAILTAFVGLSPAKKLLFKKMVSHPETFEKWLHTGKGIQKWLVRPESELLGTVSMRFSNLLGKRHFLPLAGTSFYEGLSLSQLADSKTRTEVLFYPGCLINHVFSNVGNAALSILGKHNIDVKAPQMPVCCGMPAMSAGDTDTARKLMYHNLSQLEKYEFDHVVTACPTCAYAIKKVWPMLLNADDGPHQPSAGSPFAACIPWIFQNMRFKKACCLRPSCPNRMARMLPLSPTMTRAI